MTEITVGQPAVSGRGRSGWGGVRHTDPDSPTAATVPSSAAAGPAGHSTADLCPNQLPTYSLLNHLPTHSNEEK